MAFDINDTRTLLGVIEEAFPANPVLVNTFFPNAVTFPTAVIDVDYKKGSRRLAPFVVPGGKGINMTREGFTTQTYKAPMMRPKRMLTVDELTKRMAGESVVSNRTADQRAIEYRAQDLADLTDMCVRREEFMAAQLLLNGQYDVKGYADDGKIEKIDNINFNFTQKTTMSGSDMWTAAGADAFGQIQDASLKIRQNCGEIPTVMFMSDKTSRLFLKNKSVYDQLLVPSRENMAMMSIAPRVESPEVVRLGLISSLNIEAYAYDGIYFDDATATMKNFLPDGYVIVGVKGKGRRLYGAVTQTEADGQYYTYEGRYVPKVVADRESDTSAVIVSSRCLVVPDSVDSWYVLKVF